MRLNLLTQLVLPVLAFAAATGIALGAGVDGLGEAATAGQLAFAAALVFVLVRGAPNPRG